MNPFELIKQKISQFFISFKQRITRIKGISLKEVVMKKSDGMQSKRKVAVIGISVMGTLLILCIFIIARGFISRSVQGTGFQTFGNMSRTRIIPPEELFLPEEPDFIPDFIPDRPKKNVWTSADAEPYWVDPLLEGSEKYINMIDTTLNNKMEQVR